MHLSNSYFNHFNSIEQDTLKSKNYNDYANSTVEDYKLKQSIADNKKRMTNCSSDNLYVAKLESKALELQKKLDTQTYQMDTLSAEAEHYMKICEEQKVQLARVDTEMLRQQYEEQTRELVEEKQKITELIYNLTEQYKEVEQQYDENVGKLKTKNEQLTMAIEQALSEKEQLLRDIAQLDKQHSQNEQCIANQEDRIYQLRNIERKLVIALKEMKELQVRK